MQKMSSQDKIKLRETREESEYTKFNQWQLALAIIHIVAATTLGVYATASDKDWKTFIFYK